MYVLRVCSIGNVSMLLVVTSLLFQGGWAVVGEEGAGGIGALIDRMKRLTRDSTSEVSQEELVKRFDKVGALNAERKSLSPTHTPPPWRFLQKYPLILFHACDLNKTHRNLFRLREVFIL